MKSQFWYKRLVNLKPCVNLPLAMLIVESL